MKDTYYLPKGDVDQVLARELDPSKLKRLVLAVTAVLEDQTTYAVDRIEAALALLREEVGP